VSDRFGDYGLVGAIIFTALADRFVVDTLLLSCRALGKGVEHRMVAELAARALREGKSLIELSYRATDRNEPARAFITSLGAAANAGDFTLELSAARLAQLRYEPVETPALAAVNSPRATERRSGFGRANFSAAMQRLGDEFTGIDSVVAAIDSARRPAASLLESGFAGDGSTLEKSLATIWKKVLGRTHVGLDENFFDAGGTSLKAVLVVAAIRRELKKNVSIVALFECPTIKLLAARLDDSESSVEAISAAAASAESRGRQRRNKLVKRRVA
jgi:hypothetical protein